MIYFMLPGSPDDDEMSGDERAEDLTRDAWRRGISPKELWSMPIHQLLFVWFKQPDEKPTETLKIATERNQSTDKPFILANIMMEFRRALCQHSERKS